MSSRKFTLDSKIKISASLLAADFACLGDEIANIEKTCVDYLHLDVMDGIFVPNISFGIPVIARLRQVSKLPFDVHLMLDKPENYISAFSAIGADMITIHYEAARHLHRILQSIRNSGCQVGLCLNPATSLQVIEPVIDMLDRILLMAVNPGFGGQKFIPQTFERIRQVKKTLGNKDIEIAIDGGVNIQNAAELKRLGANVLIAGSAIFKSSDYSKTVQKLRQN